MKQARGSHFKMALEQVLQVLELVMKDRLSEVDGIFLEEKSVRKRLTTYFVEKEKRPEVVSAIIAPELMQDYLNLGLEEREEVGLFHKKFPDYLTGKGDEQSPRELKDKKVRRVVQANHWAHQLLQVFDYYRMNLTLLSYLY